MSAALWLGVPAAVFAIVCVAYGIAEYIKELDEDWRLFGSVLYAACHSSRQISDPPQID